MNYLFYHTDSVTFGAIVFAFFTIGILVTEFLLFCILGKLRKK